MVSQFFRGFCCLSLLLWATSVLCLANFFDKCNVKIYSWYTILGAHYVTYSALIFILMRGKKRGDSNSIANIFQFILFLLMIVMEVWGMTWPFSSNFSQLQFLFINVEFKTGLVLIDKLSCQSFSICLRLNIIFILVIILDIFYPNKDESNEVLNQEEKGVQDQVIEF